MIKHGAKILNREVLEMRIGICDDDNLFLERMNSELNFCMADGKSANKVHCFSDTDALLGYLEERTLDMVFLDVLVKERSGFETAKIINQIQPGCAIVYCSDSLEQVVDAYETKHCYYLLKQDVERRLPGVLERAQNSRQGYGEKVCVYSHGGRELIPVSEILYIERNGKKSYFHLTDKTEVETPAKIDEIEQKLAEPPFVRCHNSFIISLDKLRKYTRHLLVMEDGREIPVSRSYLQKVRTAFGEWNIKNL